jgi:hypothetical protein
MIGDGNYPFEISIVKTVVKNIRARACPLLQRSSLTPISKYLKGFRRWCLTPSRESVSILAAMRQGLPNELQERLEAKGIAEIESYFEELEQGLRRELESLDRSRQLTIEAFRRRLRGKAIDNSVPPLPPLVEETSTRRASEIAANGIPPNTRTMLQAVLPDFKNTDFKRRDVEQKVIEKWPKVKPKTKVEAKNFTSRISQLLTSMVKSGQLKARKGKGRFDPTMYRLKEDNEETRVNN